MIITNKFTVIIDMTSAYQNALLSSLKLYHSLALGNLDELHRIGAAAIIPAKNTTRNVRDERMTPWPDVLVLRFRDSLACCMEALGHSIKDPHKRLQGGAKEEVSYDLNRILRIEALIHLLESRELRSAIPSVFPSGVGWGEILEDSNQLLIDSFYLKILSEALEVYSRIGFAQLEILAYYVDNGLIPMKNGTSTSRRKAFFLCMKEMCLFKTFLGYSETESCAFDGLAVDRSTYLCLELLRQLVLHLSDRSELAASRFVVTDSPSGWYTGELTPRVTIVNEAYH